MAKTPVIVGNPETVRKHLTGSRASTIAQLTDQLLARDGLTRDDLVEVNGRQVRAVWLYRKKAQIIYRKMTNGI